MSNHSREHSVNPKGYCEKCGIGAEYFEHNKCETAPKSDTPIEEILHNFYRQVAKSPEGTNVTHIVEKAEADIESYYQNLYLGRDGCPCLLVEPCTPNCTCARNFMSGGCMRCCKYGSDEQRLHAAQTISSLMESAIKKGAENEQ